MKSVTVNGKGGGGRLNDKPIAGDTATVGEGDLVAALQKILRDDAKN